MEEITDPILREAAGLEPLLAGVAKVGDKDLVKAPRFESDFASPAFPHLDGRVTMRYANVGDTLAIEALSLNGGRFAEAIATLQVCIEIAPASWYRASVGGGVPVLDLSKIQDAEALVDLYQAYSGWRATFRRGGK
jgi:hypothetical protein